MQCQRETEEVESHGAVISYCSSYCYQDGKLVDKEHKFTSVASVDGRKDVCVLDTGTTCIAVIASFVEPHHYRGRSEACTFMHGSK